MPESKRDKRYEKLFEEYVLARRQAIKSPYKITEGYPLVHLWQWNIWLPTMAWTVIEMPENSDLLLYDERKTYEVQRVLLHNSDPKLLTQKHQTSSVAPEPVVTIQRATLNTNEFLTRIAQAKQIHIPLMGVEPIVGMDGFWAGLEVVHEYGGFRLNWWAHPPDEWQEIVSWTYSFASYLDRHFTFNKMMRRRFKRLLPLGVFRRDKPKTQDS
jgi:hypothetical protein